MDCCEPEEAWSTCFIRLARDEGDGDCTFIHKELCPTTDLDIDLALNERSKWRYTWATIYLTGVEWTNQAAFFQAAYRCAMSGRYDSEQLLHVDPASGINTDCMSRTKLCAHESLPESDKAHIQGCKAKGGFKPVLRIDGDGEDLPSIAK